MISHLTCPFCDMNPIVRTDLGESEPYLQHPRNDKCPISGESFFDIDAWNKREQPFKDLHKLIKDWDDYKIHADFEAGLDAGERSYECCIADLSDVIENYTMALTTEEAIKQANEIAKDIEG